MSGLSHMNVVECLCDKSRSHIHAWKNMRKKPGVVLFERVERCIYLIRGERVMLSTDLAHLYGIEPKALVQAVKRNAERFPADFMFALTPQEYAILKSQIVTSSWGGISMWIAVMNPASKTIVCANVEHATARSERREDGQG